MSTTLGKQLRRLYGDHEILMFSLTLIVFGFAFYWFAVNLPALIVAMLLAYLLDGIVGRMIKLGVPRIFAISSALLVSLLSLMYLMLIGIPQITEQFGRFVSQLPETIPKLGNWIDKKLENYPFADKFNSDTILEQASTWGASFGEEVITTTLANVANLFNIVIYIVLIPLLLFFILRDKYILIDWIGKFVPKSRMLADLEEALDEQFGAYVRGKIIEGLIIFALSFIGFAFLDVNYALLLAAAIGLSVIIPFVGAIAVTVPVIAAGLVQFGTTGDFWWMLGIYTVVQVFDGQILVPLLFSEVVKIHPVAILVAILFFGAIWGVWGVFFAIPLASVIKSVIAVLEKRLNTPPAAPA